LWPWFHNRTDFGDMMPSPSAILDWATWLTRSDVPCADKVARLAEQVTAQGKLPEGCDFLWSETSRLASSKQRGVAVLPQLFSQLEPAPLAALLRATAEVNLRTLFAGLVARSNQDASVVAVLSTFVQLVDEDRLGTLIRSLGPLGAIYPAGERMLGQRLLALLRQLPHEPAKFSARLATLRAGARWLPEGDDRVAAWRQFSESFEHFVAVCRRTDSLGILARRRSERENAARQAVADLCQAMPAEWYADDPQASLKRHLLTGLIAAAQLPAKSLPKDFQQKAVGYLQTGHWAVPPPAAPTASQPRMPSAPGSHAPRPQASRSWFHWLQEYPWHAAGIATVAMAVVFLGNWIAGRGRSPGDAPASPVAQRTSEPESDQERIEQAPTQTPEEPRPSTPAEQPDTTGRPHEPPPATPGGSPPAGQESGKRNAADGAGQPPTAGGGLQPDDNPAAAQSNDTPSTAPKTPPTASSGTDGKDAKPAEKSAVLKIDGQDLAADSNLPPYILAQPAPPAPTESGLLRAGLAGVPYTVRLHGAELISVAPSSSHGELGEFDRIDSQADAEALVVTAFFGAGLNPRRVPLARFFVGEGKLKWSLETPETQRKKDDIRTLLGALPYCVLQLQPQAEAPVVFHTFKGPQASRFPLPELGATVGSKEDPLDVPSDGRWKQCYLGAGKIIAADGEEYEFGATWGDEAACDKWPIPKLKQTLGLVGEPTIELASQGELAKLVVKPAELKANEELRAKKAKKTEEKTNIERLLVKATRRKEGTTEAFRELAQALGLGDRIPSVPIPPTPLTGKVTMRDMTDFDQAMKRYHEQVQQHEQWHRDLIDKARTQATFLGEEIKEIVNPPNPDAGPVAEWLKKTTLEVEAHIYRVVPYDGPGPEREIRVLLVEPG
jgi:hypothetical protein